MITKKTIMAVPEANGFKPQPARRTTAMKQQANRMFLARPLLAFLALSVAAIPIGRCVEEPGVPARPPTRAVQETRMSFCEVPLVCPAAPQIGCGSASKPLLLELERSDLVSKAWLNRAGTTMATVWNGQSKPRQRSHIMNGLLKKRGLQAKELRGSEKQEAVTSFKSGRDWYRGSDVDRLSEEEAGVL